MNGTCWLVILALLVCCERSIATEVNDVDELVNHLEHCKPGDAIEMSEGVYELDRPLRIPFGVKLRGHGPGKTILTTSERWKTSDRTLPDPEMRLEGLDQDAYLIQIQRDTSGTSISNMTLRCGALHGAIFSWFHDRLHLHDLRIEQCKWSAIRTFGMKHSRIHDCEFVDAGGRWKEGKPGVTGGITGGAIFACWMSDCEIWNNRFTRTRMQPEHEFYGIKVRQAKRCRVHHNTIEVNFSMEFPFENDEDNEIDHNVCRGTISLPKHAGGPVPESGRTFRIHHNLFKDTYSIEFVRNGIEIDHNLFDFDTEQDHGNLISGFGHAAAGGPALFHNNLISNPGRGVIWINEVFNNLTIRNNHIVCRTTRTPRTEGLFGFNPDCDFSTITVQDNIIECRGLPRPLFRSEESRQATVKGNRLINVAASGEVQPQDEGSQAGPVSPLDFPCGCFAETQVRGWNVERASK